MNTGREAVSFLAQSEADRHILHKYERSEHICGRFFPWDVRARKRPTDWWLDESVWPDLLKPFLLKTEV